MYDIIINNLSRIEKEHNIKILYACESGSRAWGFPSKDSDYDVRFIYIRSKDWYLSIDERKDTLEFPINDVLDISGWDIRKSLKLLRASNAVVFEWLQSPIVYKEEPEFSNRMKALFPDFFSIRAGMHHYLSMAKNGYENELQGEQVKLKKYFYALRPVLACKWIAEKKETPPMEFGILRQLIHEQKELNLIIDQLLEQKSVGDEKDTLAPISILNSFIESEIKEAKKVCEEFEKQKGDSKVLDDLFRELLQK
ncbi:MAG: DNA polymerase beta superfamily protein [Cytophagaceae bacterium]